LDDDKDVDFPQDYESVVEIYYNARATPWLNISPGAQFISNPGGNKSVSDAVVLGVRAQVSF
jgi:carbohydrate-selective porin OprB